MVTPAGAAPWIPTPSRVDNTIVKAILRAFRWRDLLESRRYATVRDLAKAELINKFLPRSCPAPHIIEAILEGRQPATLELADFLKQFPDRVGQTTPLTGFLSRPSGREPIGTVPPTGRPPRLLQQLFGLQLLGGLRMRSGLRQGGRRLTRRSGDRGCWRR